ncbi:hypothetical protein OAS89_05175 [Alphaproteobacteria bacterium]|nr:hypothetical protein [Alphaproteobacteria bacterium]
MNRILLLLSIFSFSFLLVGCISDPVVDSVKNSSLESCPQKTVGQMADDFMSSPSWESLVAEDKSTYVNVEGGITYSEKQVNALIQFLVSENLDKFEFNALEFNGVPQNAFMANVLLNNMCSE